MKAMRLGIEWLSMGIAMSVTVQQRRCFEMFWHSIDCRRSGKEPLSKATLRNSCDSESIVKRKHGTDQSQSER